MNMRRAITPFALGFFKLKEAYSWRRAPGDWCGVEHYGFPETSKSSICQKLGKIFRANTGYNLCSDMNQIQSYHPIWSSIEHRYRTEEEGEATKIHRRFGLRPDSFIKFPTEKVCPTVVTVSPENGTPGSGVIIDSNGTILTNARNVVSPAFRGKINVSLHDKRKFSGTILEVNKYRDLALLKIQSEIPLPTTTFGSLGNYEGRELISIHRLLRRKAYPRSSSENEEYEEGNLMLSDQEFRIEWDYGKFSLGNCGGPIVTFDGKLVGITTEIRLPRTIYNIGKFGTIKAMGIQEALSNVGYKRDNDPEDSWDW